jgi:hypothetical protein
MQYFSMYRFRASLIVLGSKNLSLDAHMIPPYVNLENHTRYPAHHWPHALDWMT